MPTKCPLFLSWFWSTYLCSVWYQMPHFLCPNLTFHDLHFSSKFCMKNYLSQSASFDTLWMPRFIGDITHECFDILISTQSLLTSSPDALICFRRVVITSKADCFSVHSLKRPQVMIHWSSVSSEWPKQSLDSACFLCHHASRLRRWIRQHWVTRTSQQAKNKRKNKQKKNPQYTVGAFVVTVGCSGIKTSFPLYSSNSQIMAQTALLRVHLSEQGIKQRGCYHLQNSEKGLRLHCN